MKMMSDKQSRLDALKKQREQLDARIRKMQALEKAHDRKKDTRRKILMGAYLMDKAIAEGTTESLYKEMIDYLTRQSDKELFKATQTQL